MFFLAVIGLASYIVLGFWYSASPFPHFLLAAIVSILLTHALFVIITGIHDLLYKLAGKIPPAHISDGLDFILRWYAGMNVSIQLIDLFTWLLNHIFGTRINFNENSRYNELVAIVTIGWMILLGIIIKRIVI
jgi:hypothetical protein